MALRDYIIRMFRGTGALPQQAALAPIEESLPLPEEALAYWRQCHRWGPKPRVERAEKWARKLYAKGDFEELASGMASDYHKGEDKYGDWNVYRDLASEVLKASGPKGVPGILAAFEKWPREDDIAEVLAVINDPRAVPAIKAFLDRGGASASTLKHTLKSFLERHAAIAAQLDTAHSTCCLCGKSKLITDMREYVGTGYFCIDSCWRNRAQKIPHGKGEGCPYFVGGMCSAGGGDNLCSLKSGPFASCYVYQLHQR